MSLHSNWREENIEDKHYFFITHLILVANDTNVQDGLFTVLDWCGIAHTPSLSISASCNATRS